MRLNDHEMLFSVDMFYVGLHLRRFFYAQQQLLL